MGAKESKKRARKLAALFFGLMLLSSVEVALRVAGVAPDGVPLEDLFSPAGPAFERVGTFLRTRTESVFLVPELFPAVKPPRTFRIFILGGSVALGFPLESSLGLKQLLSTALPRLDPQRKYEIINAAGFGFSSREVERMAQEVIAYEPDLIILMSGHNEFLKRSYYLPEAPDFTVWEKILFRLRLSRVLAGLAARVRSESARMHWRPHYVTPTERERVEADFGRRLQAIIQTAEKAGVPVLLITCPANLQDFRPFGPSAVPEREREELEDLLAAGQKAAFLSLLRLWEKRQPEDAWLAFIAGRYSLALAGEKAGEGKEEAEAVSGPERERAFSLFQRACDRDPFPVRASSSINETVRAAARENGALLADAAARFDELRRRADYTEGDFFFDHCHLTFAGQKILAREVLQKLIQAGLIPSRAGWEGEVEQGWEEAAEAVSAEMRAESLYRIGYESGVNLDRPYRGLVYARQAVELNPGHLKARMLVERLEEKAAGRRQWWGD